MSARAHGRPGAERALAELQRVTDAALAYLTLDDLLAELLARVTEILGTDTAAILLLDEEGQVLRPRATKGIEEEVEQGVRIPVGKGFAGRIAAERRPIFLEDVDHADIMNPILRQKRIRSLLGVPLVVEGQVIGVLHVGSLTLRRFGDDQLELLQLAGDRAALAIEHSKLHEQRRVVEALQRVLLPDRLPAIPGLELAGRYRPARVGPPIGGDWYDVFTLGRGQIGLVIGDVVGRGAAAAALMAQLRTALRVYALDGHSPAAVLERLNRLLSGFDVPRMTTLAFLVLDPEGESVEVASAGHVPPLLVGPDGDARFLDVEGDVPLGVSRSATYHEHRFDVPTGSRLVLVTDGAVEVPGEPLQIGLERLRELVPDPADARAVCEAIVQAADSRPGPGDDVAVLATHVVPLPTELRTSWPADAVVLAPMRHLLRRWLMKWGASTMEIYEITVAVQEACANAIEHAYSPGTAAFEMHAEYSRGVVSAVVRDHGAWRPPRSANRGRGLPMMQALMDSVEVDRAATGTIVTLRRRLAAEATEGRAA